MPMPPQVLKQVQDEMFRELLRVVLADRDPSVRVDAAGDQHVEISGAGGQSVKIEFDPSTGLPARETYQAAGPGGVASTRGDF